MDRNELLRDRIRENKYTQTIIVSTWHPKLSAIPFILKHNFHLISSNPKLSKIFKQKRSVTNRKNKSLSDHILKNDIANQQLRSNVIPCGKCKLCQQMNTAKLITNNKLNITEKKRYWKQRYWKLQGKRNNLHCTMFQAQGLIYRTYRGTTCRALLQTSLWHQKQAR